MTPCPNPEPEHSKSGWWYLSFCDPTLPAGERWVGGCVVQGPTLDMAVRAAWARRINPGGECMGCPIPHDKLPRGPYRNRRFTTRAECAQAFADPVEDWKSLTEWAAEGRHVSAGILCICPACVNARGTTEQAG